MIECNTCKTCIHHCKKDGALYCKAKCFYPKRKLIDFFGCYEYEAETIDLFKWGKEENGEEEKK